MKRIKRLLRPLKQLLETTFGTYVYLTPPHGVSLPEDIKRLLPGLKVGTIIDVGANIGQSAVEFKRHFPTATIHCFEPSRDNYVALEQALSSLSKAQGYQVALGSVAGEARLALSEDPSMHRIDDHCSMPSFEIVQVATLDRFCQRKIIRDISILKVDTEGYEMEVLKGAYELLSSSSIAVVYLEVGMNSQNKLHAPMQEVSDYLRTLNYQPFGFYEQKHEWITASPVLRRANLAFVSPAVSGMTPPSP